MVFNKYVWNSHWKSEADFLRIFAISYFMWYLCEFHPMRQICIIIQIFAKVYTNCLYSYLTFCYLLYFYTHLHNILFLLIYFRNVSKNKVSFVTIVYTVKSRYPNFDIRKIAISGRKYGRISQQNGGSIRSAVRISQYRLRSIFVRLSNFH
jgi:hypothetical protein